MLTSRMLGHPCLRYQWYVAEGFPPFSSIREWQYNLSRTIESEGPNFFRETLWDTRSVKRIEFGGIQTTVFNSVFGGSPALPLDGVRLNRTYALYTRSFSPQAFLRLDKVKPHRVNVNVTFEALLNYHILAIHDIHLEPLLFCIDRARLSYRVLPLFDKLKGYEAKSENLFNTTQAVINSGVNDFTPPKSAYHCSRCVFRNKCQKGMLALTK